MDRYNSGNNQGNGSNRGYGDSRQGTNIQYHAGGEMGQSGMQGRNPKSKLYHMFNMEVKGFEAYLKLAKQIPEYADEFLELAETEFKEAEKVMEIFQDMQQDDYSGSSRSSHTMLETMNKEIDKMEKKFDEFDMM